uniref:Uncharacterized protein n=1 Tax=Timema bartmani TaxID=61472 RepID=A0A7R9FB62_9NEOP|nr:unnamed protein product [Timema bartmani]
MSEANDPISGLNTTAPQSCYKTTLSSTDLSVQLASYCESSLSPSDLLLRITELEPLTLQATLRNLKPAPSRVVSESTISILQALVSHGADVNCRDRRKQTGLMKAVLSGRQDAVKLLVDTGVDLHSHNVYSNTSLDMAIGRGFKDITLLLAEHRRESHEGSRKKSSVAIGLL